MGEYSWDQTLGKPAISAGSGAKGGLGRNVFLDLIICRLPRARARIVTRFRGCVGQMRRRRAIVRRSVPGFGKAWSISGLAIECGVGGIEQRLGLLIATRRQFLVCEKHQKISIGIWSPADPDPVAGHSR